MDTGKFTIRSSRPEDLSEMTEVVQEGLGDLTHYAIFIPLFTESFTATVDDKIVGVGGFVKMWNGVAECCSLWTKECASKYKLSMVRGTRNVIDDFAKRHGIWRLQATIGGNITKTWLEHIGFEYEGILRNYKMNQQDVTMYSKIYKENLRAE